jgi:hypothetical protein
MTRSRYLCGFAAAVGLAVFCGQALAADCSAQQDAYNKWRQEHSGPSPQGKCPQWSWCMQVNAAKRGLIMCECEGDEKCIKHNTESCGEKPPGC